MVKLSKSSIICHRWFLSLMVTSIICHRWFLSLMATSWFAMIKILPYFSAWRVLHQKMYCYRYIVVNPHLHQLIKFCSVFESFLTCNVFVSENDTTKFFLFAFIFRASCTVIPCNLSFIFLASCTGIPCYFNLHEVFLFWLNKFTESTFYFITEAFLEGYQVII